MKWKKKHVPSQILDELEKIKKDDNITKDADAFKRLANYSRIGRAALKSEIILPSQVAPYIESETPKSMKKLRRNAQFEQVQVLEVKANKHIAIPL